MRQHGPRTRRAGTSLSVRVRRIPPPSHHQARPPNRSTSCALRAAAGLGVRVIHISTDYVFDGEASSPYKENFPPAPRGAYGRTKAKGEKLLAEATQEYFIIRTAWLYGVRGKDFAST
ncbi:MAG: sugar nucleotide-binding protein, partial [Spirochaetes bacterium]|nr:sugar nucleotide-binding protein [Spirochaetota bacterium]